MQKKSILVLITASIIFFILQIITGFYVLPAVFQEIPIIKAQYKISKPEAKRQIVAYLNEKYNTDLFSPGHVSIEVEMIGCGCDIDPLEFAGYTARIKEIPAALVSPKTVWMICPERADPFFTDDGQLEQVNKSLEDYLKNNNISTDYLLLPSENGYGLDYEEFTSNEWRPGKGFHSFFDGTDLKSFFDQEYNSRSSFTGRDIDTYQYSVYFSIPGSQTSISHEDFYQEMEALKNSFHISLDAVLMKESFFVQLKDYDVSEERFVSYPRAFMLSPAVFFSAYQDGECYSPSFLTLMPGVSLTLNEKSKTELEADNFILEKTQTPKEIKNFFSRGSDGKIPDAALVDLLQTYKIFCNTAENSYQHVTLLIDLEALDFGDTFAGILQANYVREGEISTEYYSTSEELSNAAHTKFQIGSTLVLSTVLFPGNESMTLTICPAPYLKEGTLWLKTLKQTGRFPEYTLTRKETEGKTSAWA